MLRKRKKTLALLLLILVVWKFPYIRAYLFGGPPPKPNSELECDPLKTSQMIEMGKRVPQPTLYYWGKRNPGEEAWNNRDLRPFLRGLLASEWIEDTQTKGTDETWLSEIQLNENCFNVDNIETLFNLSNRDRFQSWYRSQKFPQNLAFWSEACFGNEGNPNPEQFHFLPSHAVEVDETFCERVVAQYLNDKKILVLQDPQHPRTWILRSQECVSKIENDEKFWFSPFWLNADLWKNTCKPTRSHFEQTSIWFQALRAQGVVIPPEGAQLAQLIQDIPPPAPLENEKMVDSTLPFAVQDFAVSFDEAIQRCLSQKRKWTYWLRPRSSSLEVKKDLDEMCRR